MCPPVMLSAASSSVCAGLPSASVVEPSTFCLVSFAFLTTFSLAAFFALFRALPNYAFAGVVTANASAMAAYNARILFRFIISLF